MFGDGDKTFYSAEVKKYNETSNLHSVQYIGDKVVEELDLSSENVIFVKPKSKAEEAKCDKMWRLYFARRDPGAPKKSKSAYCQFYAERVSRLNEDTSSVQGSCKKNSRSELAKLARAAWENMDDKEKQPYFEKASASLLVYKRQLDKYLRDMPLGGYALPPPKARGLVTWQRQKLEQCPKPEWKTHVKNILEDGYTVFPKILSKSTIHQFLYNENVYDGRDNSQQLKANKQQKNCQSSNALAETDCANMLFPRRVLRKRSASQVWSGAVATINAHINRVSSRITVKAPLCVRSAGRYDMELNHTVAQPITDSAKSVIEFVQYLLNKRGSVKTHNVMLSEPGSARQPIHTDSNWDGHRNRDPRPHYFTILIPLTDQDLETGGTRVYPGTHRDINLGAKVNGGTVEHVENPQKAGDALVFDGLLQHHGTENVSGMKMV